MKVSIDKILGSNTALKRSKKTAEDKKRALFINIIDQLQALDIRSVELNQSYLMDMNKYDSPFYLVIEGLLDMAFNKNQVSVIHFFLYERITPEGFFIELEENGVVIPLNDSEQLYEAIVKRK
jgi:hypothetical protein